jgi:DNA segregation ATPase FtsK/SpoIIIE, S-DNA-T family
MKNTYKNSDVTAEKTTDSEKKSKKPKLKFFSKLSHFFESKTTQRITGISFLLFSFYLLIAFSSFLFTWKADQDKLFLPWSDILFNPDVVVENWLGKFGALISHQFIHNWFGVASFAFILIFFLVGFKILFKISLLPFTKTFKHTLFLLLWVSVTLGYFFKETPYLGGGVGYNLNAWLVSLLGTIGTGFFLGFVLLVFTLIAYAVEVEKLLDLIKRIKPESSNEIIEENNENQIDNSFIESETLKEDELTEEPFLIKKEVTEEPKAELRNIDIQEVETFEEELEILPPMKETQSNEGEGEVEILINENAAEEKILPASEVNQKLADFGEFDPTLELSSYTFPTLDLLNDYGDSGGEKKVDKDELEANKNKIIETLRNYQIDIEKFYATIGPTVTLYEIVPKAGIRISKIKNLEDDIALSLAALGIRIIAPIPGKGTIGIEVPNKKAETVSMRTVIASDKFQDSKMELPIALGKTISNETFVADLAKMPHLLMAGATGQGKSVGLNAILVSLLYKKHPSQVKFVLVDPKKVELTLFNKIERHFLAKLPNEAEAIITDTKKALNTLNSLCIEMDQRYDILKEAQCRNIIEYNTKFIARKLNPNDGHRYLPYIVLVVDEFADLIMTAGKEVETPIARLAQLARAIGIHLIIATQRPSVNVITGIIKANFPARIAFRVTSRIDSRTILDAGGADQLIGRGDMLLSTGNDIIRIQCAFVDTPEVEKITEFIGSQRAYPEAYLLPEYIDESSNQLGGGLDDDDKDALFEEAARIVVVHQQGSASLLQRKLKLGYNRAGRIIDQLEASGIIGPFEGSKARQVLYPDENSLEQFLNSNKNNDI